MHTFGDIGRKYAFFGYWLLFAGITLYEAQFPGLVDPREKLPYPWREAACVIALLAALIGILYAVLRPQTYQRS